MTFPLRAFVECWICSAGCLHHTNEEAAACARGKLEAIGLDRDIDILGLSTRCRGALAAENVNTLRDLVSLSWTGLLRKPKIGRMNLMEIRRALGKVGLTLGMVT